MIGVISKGGRRAFYCLKGKFSRCFKMLCLNISWWWHAANLYIGNKVKSYWYARERKKPLFNHVFLRDVLPPTLGERWREYRELRRHENISDERIKKKLKGVYAEVLVELSQNQPESTSEIAEALGYGREWVQKVLGWLEQAKLVRSFRVGFEKDEKLNEAAAVKLKRRLISLKGAVHRSVKATRFYVLTLRGEGFLGHALRALGLGEVDEQRN
ncbi:MAG: hypothetical protein ABDI20_08670 [Candidatus Bipolaricaulaceae bacterium]